MDSFQTLLARVRRQGCRVTQQRAIILRALCELDGHASAEGVYEQVKRQRPGIDLSTVYRTLERLRDLRIVSQTDLGRGCAEYELVTQRPHHHLVCQGCGQVIDIEHDYLAVATEAIQQDFAFDPICDHFAIFGLCQACRNTQTTGGVG